MGVMKALNVRQMLGTRYRPRTGVERIARETKRLFGGDEDPLPAGEGTGDEAKATDRTEGSGQKTLF